MWRAAMQDKAARWCGAPAVDTTARLMALPTADLHSLATPTRGGTSARGVWLHEVHIRGNPVLGTQGNVQKCKEASCHTVMTKKEPNEHIK